MRRLSRDLGTRPLRALLAVALLEASGIVPLAPGHQAAAGQPAHLERAGTHDCAPPHDEARCQLCQTTTVRMLVPRPAPPAIAAPTGVGLRNSRVARPDPTPAVLTARPRAPPRQA